jgi:hypothetical protein
MAALSGRIQKAPSGAKGFDTDVALSLALAKKFKDDGYVFCVRYLSRLSTDDEVANGDLTRPEAENILNAGLGLMAVQHVGRTGWIPSPSKLRTMPSLRVYLLGSMFGWILRTLIQVLKMLD